MKPEEQELSYEERKKLFFEKVDSGYYFGDPQPKPVAVVTLPVSDRIAEAARTNPNSVRVSARGADGIALVEGPRANPHHVVVRVDLVAEVDRFGRPVWDRPGVAHEYNPLDALRRD